MVKKSSTWAARLKSMFVGAMIGLSIPSLVLAQTATLLPDAQQRYFNDAGQPVASGSVTYYIPGTTTKKTVWTNSTETSPTTNPVLLDAGGKPQPTGQTYGDGCYQQVVKDTNGIQIWSAVTCSTGSGGGGSTVASVGDGLAVGTVIIWNGLTLPPNYVYASGQALSRGTYSQLLATVTLVQSSAVCVATSTTLSGLTDTTQLPIGAAIEGTCISPNTTVVSKSTNSVVMSNPATASLTTLVTFFPFGDGDGASTFNVPNYNGIYLVGRCNMNNTACTSISAPFFGGPDPNALNAIGGAQFETLTVNNLPPITSTNASQSITVAPTSGLATTNVPVTSGTIAGNDYNNGMGSLGANFPSSTSGGVGDWTKATGFTGSNSISVTSTGTTSAAFSRLPPSATVNYAIKALQDNPAKIGLNVVAASRLATTAALSANTYNNGTSGVGATLTATSNGALSIDGVAVAASDQVLIKNEATQANNGIYAVSQTGSASLPYILVRATFFDQVSEMTAGTYTLVTSGTINAGSSWILQSSITTVGTDSVVFNEFSIPATIPGANASPQLYVNHSSGLDTSNNCFNSLAPCATVQNALTSISTNLIRSNAGFLVFPTINTDCGFTENVTATGTSLALNGAVRILASASPCVWTGINGNDKGSVVILIGYTLRTPGSGDFWSVSKGGIFVTFNEIMSSAVGGSFVNISDGGVFSYDAGTHQVGDGAACSPNCFAHVVNNHGGTYKNATNNTVSVPAALTFSSWYFADNNAAQTNFVGTLTFTGGGAAAGSTGAKYMLTNGATLDTIANTTTFPGGTAGANAPYGYINNTNAPFNGLVENISTGANAFAGYIFQNSAGGASFGAASTGYNPVGNLNVLANKGFVYSAPTLAGIGLYADGTTPICFYTNSGGNTACFNGTTGTFSNTGGINSTSPFAGVGYATGAGGAVTQTSSRTTTTPAINKVTGQITLVSAAGSATPFSFSVANTTIAATDTVQVAQLSGTDRYRIDVTKITAGTSFDLTITDITGTTVEQPVFNFTILKGANN